MPPPRFSQSQTYTYPNAKSYTQIPNLPGGGPWFTDTRALRHGYIFGYKSAAVTPVVQGPSEEATRSLSAAAARQINYRNYKVFQFNPSSLALDVSMMNSDHPDTQIQTGTNLPGVGVGLASTSVQLIFDRTDEIAFANSGARTGSKVWRDLGVQMDLFDLLKVISGGDTSKLATYAETPAEAAEGWGAVQAGSMNHLTGMMFDAVISGSNLMFTPFVVVFNPNLAVHVQRMTSFAFSYIRFTANLVPTTVQVDLGLEITNMGSKSYATTPTGLSTETPPPQTTAITNAVQNAAARVTGIF